MTIDQKEIHFLNKYGILAFRVLSKFELRRIAKSLGATLLGRLGATTKEEMINELADISEVIETIYEVFNISEIDVDLAKHKKMQEKGAFKSGTYLMSVEE